MGTTWKRRRGTTRSRFGDVDHDDCVAQSMAVDRFFPPRHRRRARSFAARGTFVVILTMVGILGLGYVISEFAKRFSGAGAVYEFLATRSARRRDLRSSGVFPGYAFLVGGLRWPLAARPCRSGKRSSIKTSRGGSSVSRSSPSSRHQRIRYHVLVRAQLTVVALSIIRS